MTDNVPHYRLLDHTADLGIETNGTTLSDLFEKTGNALLHLMFRVTHPGITRLINIDLEGNDLEDLMVKWLSEILYLFEGENMIVTKIIIDHLSTGTIKSTFIVSPYNPELHEIMREIKAVTYHQIMVRKKNNIWTARIIFDV